MSAKLVRCKGDGRKLVRCKSAPKKVARCAEVADCDPCKRENSRTPKRLIFVVSGAKNCGCSHDDVDSQKVLSGTINGTYRLEQVKNDPCLYRCHPDDEQQYTIGYYYENRSCGGGLDNESVETVAPEVRIARVNSKIHISSPCFPYTGFQQFESCEVIDFSCTSEACESDSFRRRLWGGESITIVPEF